MVAVSRNCQRDGVHAPSQESWHSAKQIPGAMGTESPDCLGAGAEARHSEADAYLDSIANVVTSSGLPARCPGYFVVGQCKNGHRFAKELHCGREWCPICGENDSPAHLRRFARWLPKVKQLRTMGQLVFTIPEVRRRRYRFQDRLNKLTKEVTCGDKSKRIPGMLKNMGFDRGLARWHWFGDTPGKWNPHLNVIIEAGFLTETQLKYIKRRYARILNVPGAVVHYSYTEKIPKMVHITKYVTRSTFRVYKWDEKMAGRLYNFRNIRTWGDWSGPAVWNDQEGQAKLEAIMNLENHHCPACESPLVWGRARNISWLQIYKMAGIAEPVGAGYWTLKPD